VSNAFHHGGDTVFFPEVDRCGPGWNIPAINFIF
jgi:hypothetical protein